MSSKSSNNAKRVAQTGVVPYTNDLSFPISKKVKPCSYPVSILTFTSDDDNFARLELLSSHTLFDLVAVLCEHTSVGLEKQGDNFDEDWRICYQCETYSYVRYCSAFPVLDPSEKKLGDMSLTIGNTMRLDCHCCKDYDITLVDCKQFEEGEETQLSYPRNNPKSTMIPSKIDRYVPSSSDVNLDTLFPSLQAWIFGGNSPCNVHLFQPGRKQNFGFMDKNNGRMMLYLPVKPSNLMNWIGYFDEGSKKEPKRLHGHLCHTWHSVVIIPRLKYSEKLYRKYKEKNEDPGFCDVPVVSDISFDQLTWLFPKIAALTGCVKDKKVKKGWINFHKTKRGKCNLSICCGNSVNHPRSKYDLGDAAEGNKQHESVDEPLFSIPNIEIKGLHDLFCVVEGLLMTL